MKTIYDKREAILDEPISAGGYRNNGLRLRNIGPEQRLFEDRLASVIMDFSSRMYIDIGLVQQIAKVWISTQFCRSK